MQLAQVIGTVVATQKVESLRGVKLLIVQPLSDTQKPVGKPLVAVDGTHQAGEGEIVMIESGREAALALEDTYNPADQAILGLVDEIYTIVESRSVRPAG